MPSRMASACIRLPIADKRCLAGHLPSCVTCAASGKRGFHTTYRDMCPRSGIPARPVFHRLLRLVLSILCAAIIPCGCDQTSRDQAAGLPDLAPSQESRALSVATFFTDEAARRGLEDVRLRSSSSADYAMANIMGGGVALLDYDSDGDVDIALAGVQTKSAATTSSAPGFLLFEQTSDGQFQNASHQIDASPIPATDTPAGFAVGDANNDGLPDLYLTVHGEDRFFLNNAAGGFEDVTADSGLSNLNWGTSACFFDYDRDGWLDLFVTNYVDDVPQDCVQLSGAARDFCSPSRFAGTVDRLFRNTTGESPDLAIQFEEVTFQTEIGSGPGKGLGVVAADLTGDGWPDLYVANDQEPNRLWVNQRDGTFIDEALIRGCALDALGNAQASMGIVVYDFDHDALFDLLVTHLSGERNTLYRALPDGTYEDVSARVSGCSSSLPLTGFGIAVFDIDGDGRDEAFVANGLVRRPDGVDADPADFWKPYRQSDAIYLGSLQTEATGQNAALPASALALTESQDVSRGLAAGDIDGDGDFDLLITSLDRPPRLLVNTHQPEVRYLRIRPVLPQCGGRAALGAVVSVGPGEHQWHCLVHRAGSYLTSQLPMAYFVEDAGQPFTEAVVNWPDGRREVFQLRDVRDATSVVELAQGAGESSRDD